MPSIKKSFFWSAIEQLGPNVVAFVVSVLLARLLEPEVFGLMGMLALFIGVAGVFADSGFTASLIQQKTLTPDDETSVFALNIVAGVVLALLLSLISPFVAQFYNQPVLQPLLCVLSLSIVISSFCLVQSALLNREMQFHKTALIGSISTVAGGFTGVAMACCGYGVWSLIGSTLAMGFVRMVLFWILSAWRPRGKVRLDSIRSMWSFSSYLLYCSLIGVAYQNMYSIVIGKVYSPESLGYYNRANSLRMLPVATIGGIVNRVAFPLFSRYQDDKALMLKRMREIVRSTLFLSAGGLALLAVLADPLVPLLLTEKWSPVIPLLRILCYAGVFFPISLLYLTALQAQGHSHLNARLETIKMVNGIIVVALVYRYGVTALAWGAVGLTVIAYFLNAWYNVKLLGYNWRLQAIDILPTFSLCGVAGWIAWWIGTLFSGMPFIMLFVQVTTFITLLGIGVFLLRRVFFDDAWKHLSWAFGLLRRYR